jgi:hypothetical protein
MKLALFAMDQKEQPVSVAAVRSCVPIIEQSDYGDRNAISEIATVVPLDWNRLVGEYALEDAVPTM